MTKLDGQALAVWLAHEHPGLFARLARTVRPQHSKVGALGDDTPLVDIGVSDAVSAAPAVSFDTASTDTGGGFFSSIGDAIGNVGSWLSSPTGLNSLTNLATQYFKTEQTQATAGLQQQVLQTQIARTGAGVGIAPITYQRNPVTGALTPMVQSQYGLQPLASHQLTSMMPSGLSQVMNQYGVWIIGAGVALVALLALKNR